MMIRLLSIGSVFFLLIFWGCEKEPLADGNTSSEEWSIPIDEIFDGGPGKDGIPALTEPAFIPRNEGYLDGHNMVLGFVAGDEARAYPVDILDWHEIINDTVGDVNIAVTYCPLTGTGIGWNREINGNITTFGVSGLLYNSNLIPYDRLTNSNWSQIRLDCVEGSLKGTEIETFPLVETTWRTWKKMYPSTLIVSLRTGYARDYGNYPYGSYLDIDNALLFPVANKDDRLANKERVHAIVQSGDARVYLLSAFGNLVSVIQEEFKGQHLVVVGNGFDDFVASYINDEGKDGIPLSFTPVQDQYPVVMKDQEGNNWDVFGRAVSGARKGDRLKHTKSFMGYWFSFAAFYPNVTIYGAS